MARTQEGSFQDDFISALKNNIRGIIVLKNDASYLQGFPDLTVIGPNGFSAVIECKSSKFANYRPNQLYYLAQVKHLGHYSKTLYPENIMEVLDDIQRACESDR